VSAKIEAGAQFSSALRSIVIQMILQAVMPPCVREVVRCSIFPLFLRWAG